MTHKSFRYGRLLEDFDEGATYEHPWDVTIDGGALALFQASFLDATPVFASARYARELGFRDRPLPPQLLLNLGLGFSVHDVSEQAIAHLAYLDVKFPEAAYTGDTLTAASTVVGKKLATGGDRGVVHVRTIVRNQSEQVVCSFERKALVRAGGPLQSRPPSPYDIAMATSGAPSRRSIPPPTNLPPELREYLRLPKRRAGFAGFARDFAPGTILAHENGRTVSEAEHMQLASLVRNSHPLHSDEVYCKAPGASFAGTRVVCGGLVFAWVAALASRDTCGNVVWDLGYHNGAHPSGVVGGDTLFAASKVLAKEPHDAQSSHVTFRLVGTKNVPPTTLLAAGRADDLFTAEHGKEDDARRVKEKVFEVDRTVLMLNQPHA
jgi:2-methylfumaryl-CoA hydratase